MLLIGGSEVAPASIPPTPRICPIGLKAKQMSNANDDKSPLSRAKMAATRAFKPWTDEDVARFEAHHAVGSTERLALALYRNLGIA
jgi:hypothetical protein